MVELAVRSNYEKVVLDTTLGLTAEDYENPMHKVELLLPTTYQPDLSFRLDNGHLRLVELKGGYMRSDAAMKLRYVKDWATAEGHELMVLTDTKGKVQHRKCSIVEWGKMNQIPVYIMPGYLPEWLPLGYPRELCAWEVPQQ